MKYFSYLSAEEEQTIFFIPPEPIFVTEKPLLEYALGATLYMPATRKIAVQDISGKLQGLMSMVLCFEDAIGDNEIATAEEAVVDQMNLLELAVKQGTTCLTDIPLIFIRLREAEQMARLAEKLGDSLRYIAGFVFPKFTQDSGLAYLEGLEKLNKNMAKPLYGMPILESREIIYVETRRKVLLDIRQLLGDYRQYILNVRIGATDLSGIFGLRRSPDLTIYDIAPIRDCIADIVNVFSRPEDHYVVSGPVWEFFSSERVLKPQLRQGPFVDRMGQMGGRQLRSNLLCRYIDGLIHEVLLDKANGLIGKTIIHPSHIKPIQALSVVSHEEYSDALSILSGVGGEFGVLPSQYANKMNEIKPHSNWAKKIMLKSKVYGVFNEQHNFTSLLDSDAFI